MKKLHKKLSFWFINLFVITGFLGILAIVLLISKTNIANFFWIVFIDPWTSLRQFSGFINVLSFLILVGVASAICFKYKVYNFGIPGQMLFSTVTVYIVAVAIENTGAKNRGIAIFLVLLAALSGALFAFIASLLKLIFNINEIISTILFNFIGWEFYKSLLNSNNYKLGKIPTFASLRFSNIAGPMSNLNLFSIGAIIALVVLVLVILALNNRTFGFKPMLASKNSVAAKQARINPIGQTLVILPISGGIAGIAGYLYFLGNSNTLPKLNFLPQNGFYGISVAALAFFQPVMVFFSAFLLTFFILPIEVNSLLYMNSKAFLIIILGIIIFLFGLLPFIWKKIFESDWIYEKLLFLKKLLAKPYNKKKLLQSAKVKQNYKLVAKKHINFKKADISASNKRKVE